jgi:hypothetical protein
MQMRVNGSLTSAEAFYSREDGNAIDLPPDGWQRPPRKAEGLRHGRSTNDDDDGRRRAAIRGAARRHQKTNETSRRDYSKSHQMSHAFSISNPLGIHVPG